MCPLGCCLLQVYDRYGSWGHCISLCLFVCGIENGCPVVLSGMLYFFHINYRRWYRCWMVWRQSRRLSRIWCSLITANCIVACSMHCVARTILNLLSSDQLQVDSVIPQIILTMLGIVVVWVGIFHCGSGKCFYHQTTHRMFRFLWVLYPPLMLEHTTIDWTGMWQYASWRTKVVSPLSWCVCNVKWDDVTILYGNCWTFLDWTNPIFNIFPGSPLFGTVRRGRYIIFPSVAGSVACFIHGPGRPLLSRSAMPLCGQHLLPTK